MTSPAHDDDGNVGIAHQVQPPAAPPDHVQQSVAYGIDFTSGELRAYEPIQRPQDGRPA